MNLARAEALAARRPIAAFVAAAAEIAGVSPVVVVGASRKAALVRARDAGMLLAWRAGYSSVEIGRAFGGRDHTTVLSALRREGVR